MRKDELVPIDTPPAIPALPVLCDNCRDKGVAAEGQFAMIPDIMAFTPVPRRAHVNNWTETHQRSFIAALAITGSPKQAARAVGRHQFGAEQLRKARGGKSFAAAWDAAIDIAQEREAYRVTANLVDLAAEREAELVRMGKAHHYPPDPDDHFPPDGMDDQDYEEQQRMIRERLLACRRLYLAGIAHDPARRAAWDLLCFPVDWEKAARGEAQDNEPFDPDRPRDNVANFREPDMLIPADNGFLHPIVGGPDAYAEFRREDALASRLRDEGASEEEIEEYLKLRREKLAEGWSETEDGALVQPW